MASARTSKQGFRRFWLGQAASNLGDAFGFVAMPLLAFEATHSVVRMGTVTAVAGVGQLVATTFSGVLVDRVHRRRLMIGCDLARLVLYGALPLCALAGVLHWGVLVVVALLTGVASNLFMVGYWAAVANLVEPAEVAGANGRLQGMQALAFVSGSALAGAVCSRFGAAWAMGIDAVSFAASATSLATVTFRRERAEMLDGGKSSFAVLAGGVAFLFRERVLRVVTLFGTLLGLLGSVGIGAAVLDVMVFRMRDELRLSSSMVGGCLALAALGAVLGAAISGTQSKRFGLGMACLTGTALQGFGMLAGGFGHGVSAPIVAGVLWAGGLTFRAGGVTSLRQTLTPDALLGRVAAASWALVFSASALGAVFVTRLAAAVGAASAMKWIGIALVTLAVVGAGTPLWAAGRGAPAPELSRPS